MRSQRETVRDEPQSRSMCDRHQSNASLFGVLVNGALDVYRDGAGALVEQRVLRLVVEEPRDCHALLLAARQNILPIADRVEAVSVGAKSRINETKWERRELTQTYRITMCSKWTIFMMFQSMSSSYFLDIISSTVSG